MLDANTVKTIIQARGTKIATVVFVKKDGSERVANGLFRPSSHIIGSERGMAQGERMASQGYVPFYDLAKQAWICFHQDNVVEIR